MYGDTLKTYEYERGNLLKKFTEWGRENEYFYNHQGIRYEKRSSDGVTTKYYLDGAKILGEDRTDSNGNVKKIRYFYDLDGLCGFQLQKGSETPEVYTYIKDGFGNIVMLENKMGQPIVRYDYDMFGGCSASVNLAYGTTRRWVGKNINISFADEATRIEQWDKPWEAAEVNPFRRIGHYYDAESGYYYINSRYYDPYAGVYVDADDPENNMKRSLYSIFLDKKFNICNNKIERSIYMAPSFLIVQSENSNLKISRTIGGGLIYTKDRSRFPNVPDWFGLYVLYGEVSVFNGLSLLSLEVGITKFELKTPKFFEGLEANNLLNPNLFIEFSAMTAEANIGLGVSGNISILSVSGGIELGDSVSASVTFYAGVNFSVDFSDGIEIGYGFVKVSIEFSWVEFFGWVFGG